MLGIDVSWQGSMRDVRFGHGILGAEDSEHDWYEAEFKDSVVATLSQESRAFSRTLKYFRLFLPNED